MGNSEAHLPAWLVAPFGGPLDDLGEQVQVIEAGWQAQIGQEPVAVGPVSDALLERLERGHQAMEAWMAAHWPAAEWADYQTQGWPALPATASTAERVARAELDLVCAWSAQTLHAYWAGLNPADRHDQRAALDSTLAHLPLTGSPLSSFAA
jgi:hypothetical protein